MIALLFALSLAHAAPRMDFPGGEVSLPWNDFQTLYQKGLAPDKPPENAPRDYTLDHAIYSGHAVGSDDDAFATFHLSMRGRVQKQKGWTVIPLLSTAASLKSAKIGGKDAPIYLDNGMYTLITPDTGAFDVELDFSLPLSSADGETALSLQLAPSGATELSFSVDSPEAVQFELPRSAGLQVTHTGTAWTVNSALMAWGSMALSWRREIPQEKAEPPRVYAETHTLVGVSEGVLQCHATVNYTVLHAGVPHLRVRLPTDVTVLDVTGAGLRDWTLSKEGIIDVALNYDALGAYRLSVDYEKVAAASNEVPLVEALDVAREKSFVGVDARSAVELVAGKATNATPVDVRELPPAILGLTDFPVLLGYKSRGGDVHIPLEIRTHPDVDMLVTLVDTEIADTLVTVDGRRMTHVQYAVRNNRNQFLKLSLPDGAEVWSASVAGRAAKVAKGDSGGVLVPLVRSDASGGTLSAFLVDLVYVEKGGDLGAASDLKLTLPSAEAPVSQLQWTVYVPDTMKVKSSSFDGSVRDVSYFSSSPELPSLEPVVQQQAAYQMNAEADAQAAAGSMGQGVAPVEVRLPLAGQQLLFEKTLVLDEALWVGFHYKVKEK